MSASCGNSQSSSSSEVDSGVRPGSPDPLLEARSIAPKTSQSGTSSSRQSVGQPSRPPPSRAPSNRSVPGQSNSTGLSGGQPAPTASASADMAGKNARRADARRSSGSSTN